MQSDTQTPSPETAPSNESDLGKLSFAEYQNVRRGGEVKSQSAPESKDSEQKKSAKSEPAETEDESDESEDESGDELDASKDQDDKPKKKGGYKRRIDKLIASKTAAQQELEYWKSQAMKNGATEQPKKDSPVVESKPAADGKPSPDTFETHAEYVEALTDWKLEQRDTKQKQEAEKSKVLKEQEAAVKSHLEREKAFMDKNDDYKEVVGEWLASSPHISLTLEQLIVSSENGPAIMYELAKNMEEFDRINKLPPLEAARALGRIESKIIAEPSDDKKLDAKKITSAPKPLSTVGGSSKGSITKSTEEMSYSEYEKHRRAQLKRR